MDAQAVKKLRQMSGAGMMDAKKALMQTGGDVDKALDALRKKGLASADKKAGRLASEGAIGAYIHAGSRCGFSYGLLPRYLYEPGPALPAQKLMPFRDHTPAPSAFCIHEGSG